MNWPTAALGEVCDIVSGATPRTSEKAFWNGNILWVTPKDLSNLDGPYIEATPRTITEVGLKSCAASLLPKNSVLLSSRAPIGLVAINTVPMATNQGFKSLVPNSGRVDSKFLFHWLKSKTSFLQGLGNGATFKEVSKAIVERIEIPLPPLDEQQRIASILDKADSLRRKRKHALELLDSLTQSIFLTSSRTQSARRIAISDFAQVRGGKRLPKGHDYCDEETGYKYLRVSDLQKEDLRRSDLKNLTSDSYSANSRYTVNDGDVVISIAGTIGATRYIDAELNGVNLTENAAKIVIQDRGHVDPVYLSWALQLEAAQSQIRASTGQVTIGKLALFRIEQLEIDVPNIETQRDIRRVLEEQQKNRRTASLALANIDLLFSSLQHRAFSGQL